MQIAKTEAQNVAQQEKLAELKCTALVEACENIAEMTFLEMLHTFKVK